LETRVTVALRDFGSQWRSVSVEPAALDLQLPDDPFAALYGL